MNLPLPGFSAQRLLRSSVDTRTYQARRDLDGREVIAKVFRLRDRMSEVRVEHEFRLLQGLELDGVVRALGLERAGDELVLLLERIPGVNLREFASGEALELEDFVQIALSLAQVLAKIHARQIIHRDIKPSNIMIEPDHRRVHYADFGISVLMEHERRNVYEPTVIAGTLPYISPEQTGRTEHEVDFRSDLYSLGVTLYELLSGRRPFESEAPIELLHAHLARRPVPVYERREGVPRQLSQIVMRLLEKAPEHRYQSAQGLAADLERFAKAWRGGEAEPDFPLGQRDFAPRLQLPRQLYGRDAAQSLLWRELAASNGAPRARLLVMRGAPGLGKSALIDSLASRVLGEGGMLARGAHAPGQVTPYLGITQALSGLVEQLLTYGEEELAQWREELSETLGSVVGVALELIPPLALLLPELSKQHAASELEPDEARARLHLVVGRLLSVFSARGPLVLALDDMQWADVSSVALLRELLIGVDSGGVLILAATREQVKVGEDASASEDGGLTGLVRELAGQGLPARELQLEALTREQLCALLSDTLGAPPEQLDELTTILARKTTSNPQRVRQFLLRLVELGHLRVGDKGWEWDLDGVAAADIPDELVELMAAKLSGLEESLAELLRMAACVGPEFELPILAEVSGRPELELVASLYELVELGLLAPHGSRYRFTHGDIREAVRAKLDAGTERELRARIGEVMLAHYGPTADQLGERLYEVVEHLLCGVENPETLERTQRRQFAVLAAAAGDRALRSAAWEASRDYLRRAVEVLEPDARDEEAFELHFAYAQSLALTNARSEAEAAFDELLGWELPLARYGHVVARRVRIEALQERYEQALELGLAGLARCGFSMPRKASLLLVIRWVMRAWGKVRKLDLDALMALPEASDEGAVAAMYICTALKPPSYVLDTNLFAALTGFHAFLVARYGFHPSAPVALSQLGIALATALSKPAEAGVLADNALKMASRTTLPTSYSRALANSVLMIWPTCRPWAYSVEQLPTAQRVAREAGDIEMAGFVAAIGLGLMEQSGRPLGEVLEWGERWTQELRQWGTAEMKVVLETAYAHARVLAKVEGDAPLTHEQMVEREFSAITIHAAGINRAMRELLLGDLDAAERSYALVEAGAGKWLLGSPMLPRMAVVGALLATGLHARGQRRQARQRMRRSLRITKGFVPGCAENFTPQLEFVRAEQARMRGDEARAEQAYERARIAATNTGQDCLAGLALERLADMAEAGGRGSTALGAARLSLAAYRRWGGRAVVERVEARFADLLRAYGGDSEGNTRVGTLVDTTMTLDVEAVLDTLALNEELELDTLVARVLDRAITHAGADRGTLLLELDGEMRVVAQGDSDAATSATRLATPLPLERVELPASLVNYVLRTGDSVILDDAQEDARFGADAYVRQAGVRALMCIPILKQGRAVGALVLENRLNTGCFSGDRSEILSVLVAQAASAFDNAQLYGALQRSEAQWRSLVDGVPDIIALINREGVIEFINHLAPYDRDASKFVGMAADFYMSPPYQRAWRQLFAEVLEYGERRELEIEMRPQDASPVWYLTRIAPVRVDGKIAKALSISTDITMRKLAEVERSEFEAQLRQQQRLEAVGTLAAGIAHEINNPIQGILSLAELIADTPEDTAIVSEYVEEIVGESQRMAGIIRNLLSFSRQDDAAGFEPCAVDSLVGRTTPLIRSVLRKDAIELQIHLPKGLPQLHCRPQQLQQILMNLMVNARDALKEGRGPDPANKWVRVSATNFERDGTSWVRISVSDNAGGIPDAVRLKIFDPFFTTKGKEQGTGLGLSVSHGIAAEHGGELWVETELGQGSSFHLELPAGP